MKKTLPFFAQQFSEAIQRARAYGVAKPIGQIADSNPEAVSLSTLKAAVAGKHVRPDQFKIIRRLFEMRPLDWLETKIRYVEAHNEEYLAPPTDRNLNTRLDADLLAKVFDRQRKWREEFQPSSHAARLQAQVKKAFDIANTTTSDICSKIGPAGSKKDKTRISRQTLDALHRGECISPKKLHAVSQNLAISRQALSALKIAHAEAYLNEYLLGDDINVLRLARSFVDYPRTASLLIFSSENLKEFA